jgi:retinol dehydrogenase-12
VILKAGLATRIFEIFEGDESCVTVNVISKIFLVLLLILILHASTARWNTVPTLIITCSEIYSRTKFPERYAPDSL